MDKKTVLCIGLALLSFSAQAQNSGATKGVPFQDVQNVLQAASDALAAAVSANTSNIEANAAAIDAETAAREAEDAALLAKFAADLAMEVLARIEGDNLLADALAAEELARIQGLDLLGTRIDALETSGSSEAPAGNELTYEETDGYDLNTLREDIFDLDYLAGEWLYMEATNASSGLTSAICTSHPDAYNGLVAYVGESDLNASLTSSSTFIRQEGGINWVNISTTLRVHSYDFRITALNTQIWLIDAEAIGFSPESEIITNNSGSAIGNTAVLRASADRMEACGF